MLTAIVAVAGVALLGLFMRRSTGASGPGANTTSPEPEEHGDEDPADESAGTVAVTSDGWSFVPLGDRGRVRLIPPTSPREMEPAGAPAAPEQLVRGDLIAARVRRGAPDHDPWRLEALGRDHEYRAWRFETEEAARAALALVSPGIVVAPRDDEGSEIVPGDDEYMEARRREEEIEAELAGMSDAMEPEEGAGGAHLGARGGDPLR